MGSIWLGPPQGKVAVPHACTARRRNMSKESSLEAADGTVCIFFWGGGGGRPFFRELRRKKGCLAERAFSPCDARRSQLSSELSLSSRGTTSRAPTRRSRQPERCGVSEALRFRCSSVKLSHLFHRSVIIVMEKKPRMMGFAGPLGM